MHRLAKDRTRWTCHPKIGISIALDFVDTDILDIVLRFFSTRFENRVSLLAKLIVLRCCSCSSCWSKFTTQDMVDYVAKLSEIVGVARSILRQYMDLQGKVVVGQKRAQGLTRIGSCTSKQCVSVLKRADIFDGRHLLLVAPS
jgi:hypothetical protein